MRPPRFFPPERGPFRRVLEHSHAEREYYDEAGHPRRVVLSRLQLDCGHVKTVPRRPDELKRTRCDECPEMPMETTR